MKKLPSLTIFFPFYNDEGTVAKSISDAYRYGRNVTDKLEVIAIHGGNSADNTWEEIKKQKKTYRDLIIIDKHNNLESYAIIKYGFLKASKEWIFYTDGDMQYHLDDLKMLVKVQRNTGADVVNGYKKKRRDNQLRTFLGSLYKSISHAIFALPISDLTCDFRLIRANKIKTLTFHAKDSSILVEMIKKLQSDGARFAETPVSHYQRVYGKSTYTAGKLFKERLIGDLKYGLGMYNKKI